MSGKTFRRSAGVAEPIAAARGGKVNDIRDAVDAAEKVRSSAGSAPPAVAAAVQLLRGALAKANPMASLAPISHLLDASIVPSLVRLVGSYLDTCGSPSPASAAAAASVPSPEEVAFDCFWCLTNLGASEAAVTKLLVKHGVIALAVRAVREGAHDEVIENAVWTLGNIVGDGVTHRRDVFAAGGVEAVAVRTACELGRLGFYPFGSSLRNAVAIGTTSAARDANVLTVVGGTGEGEAPLHCTVPCASPVLKICTWALGNLCEGSSSSGSSSSGGGSSGGGALVAVACLTSSLSCSPSLTHALMSPTMRS